MNHLYRVAGSSLVSAFLALAIAQHVSATDDPSGRDLAFALQSAFAEAIEKAEPSIVSIVRIRHQPPLEADFILRDPDIRRFGMRRDNIGRGVPSRVDPSWFDPSDPNFIPGDFGSGVVIDSTGLILTNHHVIANADQIWVVSQNGTVVTGTVWSADPRSDLAIIRVSAGELRPIRLGDAGKMKKGHIVVALGNPYATAVDGRATASIGILSNVARRLPPTHNLQELTLHHSGTLFQTDAKLNLGFSGGALLNLDGEMIGLATSLAAIRGFDQAAGYAIPMDETMQRILAVLREGREVEYGFLAIAPEDIRLDESAAKALGLSEGEWVRVTTCYQGGPAQQAGIRVGDMILEVDGTPIRSREDVILTVGTRFAGTRVTLTVLRDKKRMKVPVTLAKYPVAGEVIASVRPPAWRGMRVDFATLLLKQPTEFERRMSESPTGGVLVTEVEPDSPASASEIKPDTLVTHVGKKSVKTPAEFYQAVRESDGEVTLETDAGKITIGN